MSYNHWTPAEATMVANMEGNTWRDIADALNKHFGTDRTGEKVRDAVRKGMIANVLGADPPPMREKREWGDDGSTLVVSNRAFSDEEMAAMFDVDMDLWKVDKRITNVYGKQTQTKLWWVPVELNHVAKLWDSMLEVLASTTPVVWPSAPPSDSDLLYEMDLFDAHIGMKAWGPETGEDYDLNIALARYRSAFADLLARAPAGSRVLWPVGQDLFHFDTLIQGKGGATAKGTPQDVDTRWQKLFIAACDMLNELALDVVKAGHSLDIVVVAGNHDTQTTFYAGQYLSAALRSHANVFVDNSPRQRKYYSFGDVLLGFTHGNEEKGRDLFGLMAEEASDFWSLSNFREWHLGHRHQEECREDGRTRIRTMPALSATDSWHASKGYRSMPGARGFVWQKGVGIVRVEYYHVPREEALTDPPVILSR